MKVTELIQFGSKVIELFDAYVESNKIKPPTRPYVRHFYTELKISERGTSSASSSEIIEKPFWARIVHDFMKSKIIPMPEFIELFQSIAKKYKRNIHILAPTSNVEDQASWWLQMFSQRLIYEKLGGSFSQDSLVELASLFKSELELAPTEYKYVVYLHGLFLEVDSLTLNDNVLVRRVQKADLEYEGDIAFDIPSSRYIHPSALPSSIMEITMYAKDQREGFDYIDRISNALRIYRLGSIYSKEIMSTSRTAIWLSGVTRSSERATSRPPLWKYTLKEPELDSFISFVNTIEQRLTQVKEEKERRILDISISRYNSALLDPVDIDIRLMNAVMGLESLFTFEKDRGENAYKLGIRVAILLGYFDFAVEEVRQLVEQAYNHRNKVVHGSLFTEKDKERMHEITPKILNYLRVSLAIFTLESQKISKDKLIEDIDKSAISDREGKKLGDMLTADLQGFKESICELTDH